MAASDRPALEGPGAERLVQSQDRIVITGATGWLGQATLELLHNTLGETAFRARVNCFGSAARSIRLRAGLTVPQAPLLALHRLDVQPTILLHHAFLTKDKVAGMDEEAFAAANRGIRRTVLDAIDRIGVHAAFVPSSGAARHAENPAVSPAMRIYGRMKREDEDAFAAWAETGDRRAVIVRVFNISGPYINKHTAYALADFILKALNGEPIAVHAPRRVLRSYVAIRELMSIVFGLLTGRGGGVDRFDTGGEPMELKAVAEAVSRVLGPVTVVRAACDGGAADDYLGDPARYLAHRLAQQVSAVPFDRQIIETATHIETAAAELAA